MSTTQNKSNAASKVASVANSEATSAASVKPVSAWQIPQTAPKAPEISKIEELHDDSKAKLAQKQKERDDKDSIIRKGRLEKLAKIKADRDKRISGRKEELVIACGKYYASLETKLENLDDNDNSFDEMNEELEHLTIVDKNNILDEMKYDQMTKVYKEIKEDVPNWMMAMFQNSQNSISSNAPPLNKPAPSSSSSSSAPPPAERKSESTYKRVESKKKAPGSQKNTRPSKCGFQSKVDLYLNKNGELCHISKQTNKEQVHLCGTKGHGHCKNKECPETHYCPYSTQECGCHAAKQCKFEAIREGNCTNKKCTFRHWDESWIWAKQWEEAEDNLN